MLIGILKDKEDQSEHRRLHYEIELTMMASAPKSHLVW